jgi:hypothetical protein
MGMQDIESQIEKLRWQLDEYTKAWANDDINNQEYWKANQAINKQISKLRENQPSNFNSPIPTPEQAALKSLKIQAEAALKPYWNRVAPKHWKSFQITLKLCKDAQEVRQLYSQWQIRLSLKNIAVLPDLKAA